jgi:hypothetical protein
MHFLSVCTALLIAGAPSLAFAGKLDEAGDATREDEDSGSDSWSDDEDDDSVTTVECDACAYLLVRVIFSPWSLPRELLESDRQTELWYDDYPYARSYGYVGLRYEPLPETPRYAEPVTTGVERDRSQRWAAQASLEGGANLDGVGRGAIRARMLMPVPIELEVEAAGLVEQDPSGTDWATLSAGRLNWRFAEATSVQFRTSVGVLHWFEDADANDGDELSAEQRTTPGFDFGYGFDAFVHRPFILSAEGHLGALGEAFTWQARATLGAMFGPVEGYAGYQELNVGGVSLGGPLAGIRAFL